MKTKTYYLRWTGGLIAVAILRMAQAESSPAAGNDNDLAVQINYASVLYQPLVRVGNGMPTEAENQVLWAEVEKIQKHGVAPSLPALEQFVSAYPNSPWLPSLEANLGQYYEEHARFDEAIQSWRAAWAATHAEEEGAGKQVADFTFAHWTHLLVGLGQVNTVRPLLEEAQGRTFADLPLRVLVNNTREEYKVMVGATDVSFRCGAYALNDMLRALKQPALDVAKVMRTPSPVTGFSLNKLMELGRQSGAELVAAEWGPEKNLVVPAVVHWKQDHYAAILMERNGLYQVMDLAVGKPVWLCAADIQMEASGYFIVPKDKLPKDWKQLSTAKAEQIYGRGYVSGGPDGPDGCGNGSGGGSSTGN